EIVAVWDETPERGRAQAKALNVPFYEKLDDILGRPDIDGVIVDTPTNLHHDVMIAAAQAGKHIFTEKVIAPTLREVNEILASVEHGGGQDWQDWTMRIPQDRPLAFSQWVNHIQQKTTATENIQVAVNLTSLMEAANISARTRQAGRLSSL